MALSSIAAMVIAQSQAKEMHDDAVSGTYTRKEIDEKLNSLETNSIEFEDQDIDFSKF